MKPLRILIKFPLFALILINYFFISIILLIFHRFSFNRARRSLTKIISLTGQMGLRIIGIKVILRNEVPHAENFLVVSNHLSYVDVLAISSVLPSCFVTSKEMKDTPFLGQICLLGGCLFVDRKKKGNIHNEIRELTNSLNNKINVAIFPESTSTNGTCVIPFKRPLFQAAIDSRSKVLPICLNYLSIDHQYINHSNRDNLFWYDETPFLLHALKLFSRKLVVMEIIILPTVNAWEYEDKTQLAKATFDLIESNYKKILS